MVAPPSRQVFEDLEDLVLRHLPKKGSWLPTICVKPPQTLPKPKVQFLLDILPFTERNPQLSDRLPGILDGKFLDSCVEVVSRIPAGLFTLYRFEKVSGASHNGHLAGRRR